MSNATSVTVASFGVVAGLASIERTWDRRNPAGQQSAGWDRVRVLSRLTSLSHPGRRTGADDHAQLPYHRHPGARRVADLHGLGHHVCTAQARRPDPAAAVTRPAAGGRRLRPAVAGCHPWDRCDGEQCAVYVMAHPSRSRRAARPKRGVAVELWGGVDRLAARDARLDPARLFCRTEQPGSFDKHIDTFRVCVAAADDRDRICARHAATDRHTVATCAERIGGLP